MAGRLDNWSDAEVTAAVTELAVFSDWAQGVVGVGRAAQQVQLDAELTRRVNQVPTQGLATIGELPYHVSGLPDGKIQQEAMWRFRAP